MTTLSNCISDISSGNSLSEDAAYDCLTLIFSGEVLLNDIKQLLGGLAEKGESVEEIVGFARAMRDHMVSIDLGDDLLDLCGTGGSGQNRFNVSTASAFLLSALEVPVAKHGNRGSKKANGSFDFLEALGISFEGGVEDIKETFRQTNLCFLFARNHHPAMRFVVDARKEMGIRTIFNLIGPLCNPANVAYQVIGTTSKETAEKIGFAIQKLGSKRAMVVVGGDGRDEVSLSGASYVYDVKPDYVDLMEFHPEEMGVSEDLGPYCLDTAEENATLFKDVFSVNNSDHPIAKWVAINSALCLNCVGHVASIEAGYEMALKSVSDGTVWKKYERYRECVIASS